MIRVLITCLCVLAIAGCKKSDDAVKKVQAQAKIDDALIADYISKNNLQATKVMIGNADTTGVWFINTQTGTEAALITNSSLLTGGYTAKQMGSSTIFAQTTN